MGQPCPRERLLRHGGGPETKAFMSTFGHAGAEVVRAKGGACMGTRPPVFPSIQWPGLELAPLPYIRRFSLRAVRSSSAPSASRVVCEELAVGDVTSTVPVVATTAAVAAAQCAPTAPWTSAVDTLPATAHVAVRGEEAVDGGAVGLTSDVNAGTEERHLPLGKDACVPHAAISDDAEAVVVAALCENAEACSSKEHRASPSGKAILGSPVGAQGKTKSRNRREAADIDRAQLFDEAPGKTKNRNRREAADIYRAQVFDDAPVKNIGVDFLGPAAADLWNGMLGGGVSSSGARRRADGTRAQPGQTTYDAPVRACPRAGTPVPTGEAKQRRALRPRQAPPAAALWQGGKFEAHGRMRTLAGGREALCT